MCYKLLLNYFGQEGREHFMKIKKVDNNELFSIKTIYEIKND